MNIQKINGAYVADEDRIMLRISTANGEELRFWITRRSCLTFLAETRDFVVKSIEKVDKKPQNVAKVIDEFHQDQLAETLDYAVPFEPQNKLPLGHEPILIKTLKLQMESEMPDTPITLQFGLSAGKWLQTSLIPKQLNAIRLLIKELVGKAQWEDGLEAPQLVKPTSKPSIH